MMYEAKNYDRLLGMTGFSDQLLKNHFTLYQGYVKNTNNLNEHLSQYAEKGQTSEPEFAEMKRRFGWEFNGMRLHEYYFGNMKKGGSEAPSDSELMKKIKKQFGSMSDWEKDFKGTGAMRGIGWVVMYYDSIGDRLLNVWIDEHDVGHLSGAAPILVMDVFEHAFMIDYGLKRAEYINAFFKVIDWEEAQRRFELALVNNQVAAESRF